MPMEVFTVCLFGHRMLNNPLGIERKLEDLIYPLFREKVYVDFLVGRDGEFDLLAASVIHRLKKTYREDNSSLIWVQPYETAEYRQHESDYLAYYDEVQICESTHYKSAFQQRIRAMIDRSDLVIVYVDRQSGGAYQSLRYAQKHHKQVVNLCEDTAVHT